MSLAFDEFGRPFIIIRVGARCRLLERSKISGTRKLGTQHSSPQN